MLISAGNCITEAAKSDIKTHRDVTLVLQLIDHRSFVAPHVVAVYCHLRAVSKICSAVSNVV